MVQWAVPPSKKFVVEGRDYTFKDFIAHTKMRASVKANQELEWCRAIIGQHFGTDYRWTNSTGETLRFEDLLRKELDRPIETAACGGTHRLFGLSWVYHLHLQKGGKTEGIWKNVSDRLDRYKGLARSQQNKDGSFSTDFFRGPAQAPDMQLRLNTTGHIFEWLALALSDEELHEPWVRKAAERADVDVPRNPAVANGGRHALPRRPRAADLFQSSFRIGKAWRADAAGASDAPGRKKPGRRATRDWTGCRSEVRK